MNWLLKSVNAETAGVFQRKEVFETDDSAILCHRVSRHLSRVAGRWKRLLRWHRVTKAIEDSPAAEAGLRRSETVLEVDGKPAGQLSYAEISNVLIADGRECQLRIRRRNDVLRVKLKLRRPI